MKPQKRTPLELFGCLLVILAPMAFFSAIIYLIVKNF